MTFLLLTFYTMALAGVDDSPGQERVTSIPMGGNAWHVASGDVTGDGRQELIGACYDGSIRVVRLSDYTEIWRYETRAFPFDLAAADLNGDGKSEVLVASADGSMYVVGPDGKLMWRHETSAPLYQVAVARIDGALRVLTGGVDRHLYMLDAAGRRLSATRQKRTLRLIRTGDLDGNGDDEVVVGNANGELTAYRGPQLRRMWTTQLTVSDTSSRQVWRPYSLHLADLDGDGRCELLLGASYLMNNRSGVRVLASDGSERWERSEGIEFRDGSAGSQTMVVACEVDPQRSGLEVVVLNGRRVFVLDQNGRSLRTGVSPLAFANICVGDQTEAGAEVFLSSAPNGDDHVYRVHFGGRWDRAMMRMKREGKMQRVTQNLERIRRQVAAYRGSSETDRKYVHVVSAGMPDTPERAKSMISAVEFYRRRFPYANCVFAVTATVTTDERVPGFASSTKSAHRRRMSAENVVPVLAEFERAGVPFFVAAGHGCEPYFSLQTVEAILAACPRMCLGFLSSENMDYAQRLDRYLGEFWYPLMNLCKRHGKKAVMVEKCAWWMAVPAMSRFRKLVDGTYADVLVMSVEDANSRNPELQLAARAGLLWSGAVGQMSARTVADELVWNRLWQWQGVMTGHPFLRRQMVQALLGAEMFEHQLPLLDRDGEVRFSIIGSEYLELLLDMIGKGLIVPPRPEELLGASPCMIRLDEPSPVFLREAFAGRVNDEYEAGEDDRSSPFEGLAGYWGGAPTQPHYVGSYLFDQDRHALNFVPATKYGFVAIVPSFVEPSRCRWANRSVRTDGQRFIETGKRVTGVEAKDRVHAEFRDSARSMPVTVSGHVFTQVQRLGGGRLRMTLIDSGFLDPDDRLAVVRLSSDLSDRRLVDVLSGEEITMENGEARIEVPAGVFRIVELYPVASGG